MSIPLEEHESRALSLSNHRFFTSQPSTSIYDVSMKQVTQRLRDGSISVIEAPNPTVLPHGVLVDVRASLLSAGTERSKIKTGQQSLIGKARARPDQVKQVMEKAQRDGVRETIRAVRSRLDQPSALGYSAAGVVLA